MNQNSNVDSPFCVTEAVVERVQIHSVQIGVAMIDDSIKKNNPTFTF